MLMRRLLPVVAFAVLALAVTWPLPLHLTTRLTGEHGGDAGVYVWNVWVFRHEIIRHAQWPFFTDHIFAATNGADLSTHNYTVFADLLALPLISLGGVVGAFNITYLMLIATSGYATYLLVRRLTGSHLEAWIAGAAFAASPVLIARGTAHFSLVAAAPLPLFLLAMLRALETARFRDALVAGLVLGWAGYCDVYYPIYCVVMGALLMAHHKLGIHRETTPRRTSRGIHVLDAALAAGVAAIVMRVWTGAATFEAAGYSVTVRTLFTPVLVLTLMGLWRLHLALRPRVHVEPAARTWPELLRLSATALVAGGAVLAPVLHGLAQRMLGGRFPSAPIFWRSSPPGLDLVALVLPNPNHPWFGAASREWISQAGPLALPELVGSLSLVSLAIVILALWRLRGAIPTFWIAFTAAFALLSLGPFVQVARVNTYVPGPWALLRYVPGLELARSPSRFIIVATLGLSVMLGFALVGLRRAYPHWWKPMGVGLSLLLALELLPAPRPLFEASVPAVYRIIAANGDESLRVLELPGGIRDGTSSLGSFSASAQYFQTTHRKRLIGGYLSRVSERRKSDNLKVPMLATLYALSEGKPVEPELVARARVSRDAFLARTCLGYVVLDRGRTSSDLRRAAIDLLDLVEIARDEHRELYVPAGHHSCAARTP